MSKIEVVAAEIAHLRDVEGGDELGQVDLSGLQEDLTDRVIRLEEVLSCFRPTNPREAAILASVHADLSRDRAPEDLRRMSVAQRDYQLAAAETDPQELKEWLLTRYSDFGSKEQTLIMLLASELEFACERIALLRAELAANKQVRPATQTNYEVQSRHQHELEEAEWLVCTLEEAIGACTIQSPGDAAIVSALLVASEKANEDRAGLQRSLSRRVAEYFARVAPAQVNETLGAYGRAFRKPEKALPEAQGSLYVQVKSILDEHRSRCPGVLVAFRMGSLVEFFLDDAEYVSSRLGIALVQRNPRGDCKVPMCGLPEHSLVSRADGLDGRPIVFHVLNAEPRLAAA